MQVAIEPFGQGTMMVTSSFEVLITKAAGIKHTVRVPVGYVFDGASIPRLVWSVIGAPFDPQFVLAAVVHDWYCDQAILLHDYQVRVIGDAVFFALLERAGVPAWKRAAMYLAVRFHSFTHRKRIIGKNERR